MNSLDVFEVLVRENSQMLTAFIQASVFDEASVDDVWQETMIVAWRRWSDYDRSRPFGAWLRGIAKNKIHDHCRNAAGLPSRIAAIDQVDAVFEQIQRQDGDRFDDKLEALRRCIQSLPEKYESVIRLRFEQALMPAVIAAHTGRNLETVKKQLGRAKKDILECMRIKLATS